MTREISNRVSKVHLQQLVRRILKKEKKVDQCLNLIFVNNRYIRRLNRKFLKKDRPTNVLAFPGEGNFLGEIYISLDFAKKEAKEWGIDTRTEIDRLVIHGLLHLLGYTHKKMEGREEYYLNTKPLKNS